MRIIWIILIWTLTSLNSLCICQNVPSFRILAPQNICKDQNRSDTDGVYISFQPKDGLKLNFKVRIFFKTIVNEVFSQREILLIWKHIRALENRINRKDRLEISNNNLLFINKSELISGINYIFHVTGITDSGESTKEEIFTLQYLNDVLQNENVHKYAMIPKGINFMLIGSEESVALSTYVLNAKVSFCEAKYNYYLRWKIHNLDEEYQYIQQRIGTTLQIPSFSLTSRNNYKIEAFLVDRGTSKILAKDAISVDITSRGLEAFLIPTSARIGVNRSLLFQLVIISFDSEASAVQVTWTCSDIVSNPVKVCDAPENNRQCSILFGKPGRYQMMASATLNEIITNVMAEIEVAQDVISSYDFINAPAFVSESLSFPVLVTGLVPNCKATWFNVNEEGFTYFNQDNKEFGQLEVLDLEEKYLSEIVDFGNSTVDRELVLRVPDWNQFEGNSKYKFRLNVICPRPYQYTSESSETKQFVNSFFEFVIYTNSPPSMELLEVYPPTGKALRTIFQISIKGAKDLLLDQPLTFEMCAEFENYTVCFEKYMNYKVWETVLPYSATPIKIVARVCDIRGACAVNDTTIIVDYEEIPDEEYKLKENMIYYSFLRTDFKSGFNNILMATITFKNKNEELYNKLREFVGELLRKEFDRILEGNEIIFTSQEELINFISLARINMDVLKLNDVQNLEKLLEILEIDQWSSKNTELNTTLSTEYIEKFDRKKRYSIKNYVNKGFRKSMNQDYVQMYLNIMEDIITHNENYSINLVERINFLLENMCYSKDFENYQLKMGLAYIEVEKVPGRFILKKDFFIKNFNANDHGRLRLHKTYEKHISKDNVYCISIIQYPKDVRNREISTLNVKVIDITNPSTKTPFETQNMGTNESYVITLQIPKKQHNENLCLLQKNKIWSSNYCTTRDSNNVFVTCSCSEIGLFRLSSGKPLIESASPHFTNVLDAPLRNPDNHLKVTTPTSNNVNIISSTIGTTTNSKNSSITLPTTNAPQTLTSSNRSTKHDAQEDTQSKASIATYLIPLIVVLLIGLLSILLLRYYRQRHKQATKDSRSLIKYQYMNLDTRRTPSGIKYANICDKNLLTGNF